MAPAFALALAFAQAAIVWAAPAEPSTKDGEGSGDIMIESRPDPAPIPLPKPKRPQRGGGGSVKLVVYGRDGKTLDLDAFLKLIGRADSSASAASPPILVSGVDGLGASRPRLTQKGPQIELHWERVPRIQLSLPWPAEEYGYSTVWLDNDGKGFVNGDSVFVNEEAAMGLYRHFKDSWVRHTKDMSPAYEPGSKAKKLYEKSREAVSKAQLTEDQNERAGAFDRAFRETALAAEKMLFEHGLQLAHNDRTKNVMRYGLTLDESLLRRVDHYEWLIEMVQRSGANWVRLVFRSNPSDFVYARQSSFNEYDSVVKELKAKGVRVMGGVLDTAQWPSNLTPQVYAQRTKNLVLHYQGQINSWEVGSEINGDWLGGSKSPLSLDETYRIFSAAAAQVKELEPRLETVVTLYWWDSTAPDEDHSLFGWLGNFIPRGFGRNVDVVGVSLWPEDNPVGGAFERIFERLRRTLPDKRLMLGSFGYVEGEQLRGYWWLHPEDVDGGRKDLAILYTTASCGVERSVCGGFFWQTLDQMLPERKKNTDLYRVYKRSLEQLGR